MKQTTSTHYRKQPYSDYVWNKIAWTSLRWKINLENPHKIKKKTVRSESEKHWLLNGKCKLYLENKITIYKCRRNYRIELWYGNAANHSTLKFFRRFNPDSSHDNWSTMVCDKPNNTNIEQQNMKINSFVNYSLIQYKIIEY